MARPQPQPLLRSNVFIWKDGSRTQSWALGTQSWACEAWAYVCPLPAAPLFPRHLMPLTSDTLTLYESSAWLIPWRLGRASSQGSLSWGAPSL